MHLLWLSFLGSSGRQVLDTAVKQEQGEVWPQAWGPSEQLSFSWGLRFKLPLPLLKVCLGFQTSADRLHLGILHFFAKYPEPGFISEWAVVTVAVQPRKHFLCLYFMTLVL